MRDYELLLVIRSNLDEAGALEVTRNIAERIQDNEGSTTSTNVWGRRKLAYPIDKQIEATYILLKFKAVPATLKDLEFDLKLNEALLRYLIVRDQSPETTQLQEEIVEETSEVEPVVAEADAEGETASEIEATSTSTDVEGEAASEIEATPEATPIQAAPEVAADDGTVSEEVTQPEPIEA